MSAKPLGSSLPEGVAALSFVERLSTRTKGRSRDADSEGLFLYQICLTKFKFKSSKPFYYTTFKPRRQIYIYLKLNNGLFCKFAEAH